VGTAIDARFVRGLAIFEERMLVLLDIPRLMAGTLVDLTLPPKAA